MPDEIAEHIEPKEGFLIIGQQPPPSIVFNDTVANRELFRIQTDGKIIKNPDVTWDDCAATFWSVVEEAQRPLLTVKLNEAKELLKHFAPSPDHNLPAKSVPARIEKFLAE